MTNFRKNFKPTKKKLLDVILYPILPKRKIDRLKDSKYIFEGEIRIWNGKILLCDQL